MHMEEAYMKIYACTNEYKGKKREIIQAMNMEDPTHLPKSTIWS